MSRPNGYVWGVDSDRRSDRPLPGGARTPYFDYVRNQAGEPPQFWGRYIGTRGTQIRPAEVQFLHQRTCKILLVFNGLRNATRVHFADHSQAGDRRARAYGEAAARRAINSANGFGAHGTPVPDGVRIYADLEDWRVHREWLQGWFEVMHNSRFAGAGGLYGRPHRQMEHPGLEAFGLSRLGSRVRAEHRARNFDLNRLALVQNVEDHIGPELAPGSGRHRNAELEALMLGDRATAGRHSRFLWANEPRRGGEPASPDEMFPPTFSPARARGVQSMIWQYRMNCFVPRNDRYGVDLDYAAQAAFSEMW